jgi:carbonic anhydrase
MPTSRPSKAWSVMMRGNARFVAGEPRHPRQDVERRESLAHNQQPDVVLFGCSDSRLAAEIIFDKGLGDLFVVRNAGQVISDSVVGSLEYATTSAAPFVRRSIRSPRMPRRCLRTSTT